MFEFSNLICIDNKYVDLIVTNNILDFNCIPIPKVITEAYDYICKEFPGCTLKIAYYIYYEYGLYKNIAYGLSPAERSYIFNTSLSNTNSAEYKILYSIGKQLYEFEKDRIISTPINYYLEDNLIHNDIEICIRNAGDKSIIYFYHNNVIKEKILEELSTIINSKVIFFHYGDNYIMEFENGKITHIYQCQEERWS